MEKNLSKKNSIYIFGDSVMKGVVMNPKNGRYVFDPMMNNLLENALDSRVINCSYFGSTIAKGMQRIEYTLETGIEANTAIIEYGGNDCDHIWKEVSDNPEGEHHPNTKLSIFKEKYRSIIMYLKDHGISPIAMTLPPIDSAKFFEFFINSKLCGEKVLSWLGDIETIYRYQELYSSAVVDVALSTGTRIADVRSYFLDKRNYKSLICNDGIHPNEEGHKLIATALGEILNKRMSIAQ